MFSPSLQFRTLLSGTFRRFIYFTTLGALIIVVVAAVQSLIEWRFVFSIESVLILIFCSTVLCGPYESWAQRARGGHRFRSRQTFFAVLYSTFWAASFSVFWGIAMNSGVLNILTSGFVFGSLGAVFALIPINNTGNL
jgi:hypothetical protein